MNKIIKEPLLHFVILGLALFFIYAQMNSTQEVNASENIVVTQENIITIKNNWINKKGSPASDEELKKEIQRFVHEEA
ncbi:hypothetical protein N9A28_09955, partial [Sulfurimonas sp.]|nr:hypothetical protein [Sulfurimonas sp.]